jgi:tetratricopeptide (TPR) repeat protein
MKKITTHILLLAALTGLVVFNTGCTAKVKQAYHLSRADKFFAAGKLDRAEIEYMNALRNGSKAPRTFGRLGVIYFQQGRLRTAAPFLYRGIQLATNDLDLRFKMGMIYATAGKYKEATDEAVFILDRNPQDAEAPLLLAENAQTEPAIQAARQRLQKLASSGDRAAFEVALGSLAFREHDAKTAEADFKKALTLDAKSAAAFEALGSLDASQNDLTNAETNLKSAADLSPARSPRRLLYARFKLATGDIASARQILKDMIIQTPDYLPALMGLAEMSLAEKKYDDSKGFLTQVMARDPDNFDGLQLQSQLQMAQGERDQAVAGLERMTKLYPQVPQAHYQLAAAYLAQDDSAKATASLNQALRLAPNYPEAILLLAETQIRNQNPSPAIASLEKLVRQQPKLVSAQLLLADAYRLQDRTSDALVIYASLEKSFPQNAQIPFLAGSTYLQQKNNAKARQAFEQVLQNAPDNLAALEQLVNLDLSEKQFDAARQRVEARMQKDPKQIELSLLLAKVYLTAGSQDKAEEVLLKAIELVPDNQAPHLVLAQIYSGAKQNSKALAQLDAVLAKDPKNLSALMQAALVYTDEKDYKAAAAAYEKSLAVNPKFSPALNNAAYLYSENLGQLDHAFELAQRARALLSNDPSTADTLGWINLKRGAYPTALSLLSESAAKMPDEPEVQFHFGLANYMTGNETPARDAFQRALKISTNFNGHEECQRCLSLLAINPQSADAAALALLEKRVAEKSDDPVALGRLAVIYQRDGKLDKAVASYEGVLQTDPKNLMAMLNLAQLYASKDLTKASALAKAAYAQAPDNPDAEHIYGLLAGQTGDYKLSASLLQQAVQNRPNEPRFLFDFAQAAYRVGNVSDAQTAMQNAVQLNLPAPQATEARRWLDLVSLAANPAQASAASARVAEILKAEPDYAPALMVLGVIHEHDADATVAAAAYEKILARYPDFAPAQRQLAILYARDPAKADRASTLAAKARAAFPNDAALTKVTGIIAFQQGDFSKAASILKSNATVNRDDAELFYYLGTAQFKLKDAKAAKVSLQQALALKLAGPQADAAKQTLSQLK